MSEEYQTEVIRAAAARHDVAMTEADVKAERDRYRDALTAIRDVLLRGDDHLAARRAALQITDSLGLPS